MMGWTRIFITVRSTIENRVSPNTHRKTTQQNNTMEHSVRCRRTERKRIRKEALHMQNRSSRKKHSRLGRGTHRILEFVQFHFVFHVSKMCLVNYINLSQDMNFLSILCHVSKQISLCTIAKFWLVEHWRANDAAVCWHVWSRWSGSRYVCWLAQAKVRHHPHTYSTWTMYHFRTVHLQLGMQHTKGFFFVIKLSREEEGGSLPPNFLPLYCYVHCD